MLFASFTQLSKGRAKGKWLFQRLSNILFENAYPLALESFHRIKQWITNWRARVQANLASVLYNCRRNARSVGAIRVAESGLRSGSIRSLAPFARAFSISVLKSFEFPSFHAKRSTSIAGLSHGMTHGRIDNRSIVHRESRIRSLLLNVLFSDRVVIMMIVHSRVDRSRSAAGDNDAWSVRDRFSNNRKDCRTSMENETANTSDIAILKYRYNR